MALDLFIPEGFFNASITSFSIINSYSTKGGRTTQVRCLPTLFFPVSPVLLSRCATSTSITPPLTP